MFVFRSGADDARTLANELSIGDEDQLTITPSDIVGLPDYSCFARLRGVAAPFRIDTRKVEDGDATTLARIQARSREVHGRDARWVDAWLQQASALQGTTEDAGPVMRGRMAEVPQVVVGDVGYGDFAESVGVEE